MPWHRLADGRTVAAHPVGGNQVSWRADAPTDLGVTPAPDGHLTAVHVRFVMRHLTTQLLEEDLAGRSIHAVAVASGAGVLAVAGPTRSGKTRLANHLIAAGLVGNVVDDDCPSWRAEGRSACSCPRGTRRRARPACRCTPWCC